MEVTVTVGRRGTEEEASPSLSSSDPRPAGGGVGMLVFEMDDLSCDNSSFTRAGEKEKGLHVPVICVYLLACWWGHLRCEQFFLSPATCHAMQLPVC